MQPVALHRFVALSHFISKPSNAFTALYISFTFTILLYNLQATGWLLSVPGASRTILDIRIPYASSSLTQVLGYKPVSSASLETSIEMAKAAYQKAADLSTIGTPIIGIGAACALTTDRDRRGEDKAFVTAYTGVTSKSYSLHLAKGARRRYEEDSKTSRLVIKAIADAMGVGNSFNELGISAAEAGKAVEGSTSDDHDSLSITSTASKEPVEYIKDLLSGRINTLEFSRQGMIVVDAPRHNRIYLPGSFNPLHDGHKELLAAACKLRPGMEGCFELSVGNADKGRLPLEEIERRVQQFTTAQLPVVLTQAPLFTMKADLFHNSIFAVGYDTAHRLVQEQYYGTETAMLLQFAKLRHLGCSFLVAGRREGSTGKYLTLNDLDVPEVLQRGGLLDGIPEEEFRVDISSTELRAKSTV